jgi:hypothetical protein
MPARRGADGTRYWVLDDDGAMTRAAWWSEPGTAWQALVPLYSIAAAANAVDREADWAQPGSEMGDVGAQHPGGVWRVDRAGILQFVIRDHLTEVGRERGRQPGFPGREVDAVAVVMQ